MPSSVLETEIRSQPDCWAAAASLASTYRDLLPRPGERVAVIGCGTSLFIARGYAFLREQAGQGVTDAWPASEARLGRDYDRVVAITRSGTTTEVLAALAAYPGAKTVLTGPAGTPSSRLGQAIELPRFDERSVVQTRFATSVLALLRAHLGEDLAPVIGQARAILAGHPADPAEQAAKLRDADQVTFTGMGLGAALAEEAALKLREATQSWAEAYHETEYRHGPISIAQPGRVVWVLGPLIPGLAEDIRHTGAHLEHTGNDPMAELIRVHLLCLSRAASKHLDPATPRNLTRSVILDEADTRIP